LSAPSLHVVLKDPGGPIDGTCPAPSSTASAFTLGGRARRLPTLPSNPFHEGRNDFGTTCFALATTCKVARLPDGSDPQGPTETFTPGLSTGRSPFPPPGMTTMVAGRLHRRDLHPLEHQLASLQPPIIRTAGFPQYGWKAGISDGALPVVCEFFATYGLPPPFVHLAACSAGSSL
jgi:hypothetical protein